MSADAIVKLLSVIIGAVASYFGGYRHGRSNYRKDDDE